MNAKRFLKQLKEKEDYIDKKAAELELTESRLKKVTSNLSLSPAKASGNDDTIGMFVAKKIDLEETIKNLWVEFYDYQKDVLNVLDQVRVENYTYYKILHSNYIRYQSFKEISEQESYSYKYVIELHGKALVCVQKILNNSKLPAKTG